MREFVDFRVFETLAAKLLPATDGQILSPITRRIKCAANDPVYRRVGEVSRDQQAKGGIFIAGWRIDRRYSKAEIAAAKCFHVTITATFEPAGEECGTDYDETVACPGCGSGARQTSVLRLDLRKVPRNADIARTIADEWIVSQRLAERMIDAGLSGFELRPVRHKARYEDDPADFKKITAGQEILRRAAAAGAAPGSGEFYVWLNRPENRDLLEQAWSENAALRRRRTERRAVPPAVWHQLVVTACSARIVPPTRFGVHPFNEDEAGEFRCRRGDLLGLTLLSEISIDLRSGTGTDVFCSAEFVGLRQGLLRPCRALLVSPRFRELFVRGGCKGARFEVAHVV